MVEPWDGVPLNPEKHSEGHVLRVDGRIDVYRWDATDQWFKDGKDRWVAPADLVADGDEYLGQISDHAAAVQAEREACAQWHDEQADIVRDFPEPSRSKFDAIEHHEESAASIRARGDTSALAAAVEAARREGLEAAKRLCEDYANSVSLNHPDMRTCEADTCVEMIDEAIRARSGGKEGA